MVALERGKGEEGRWEVGLSGGEEGGLWGRAGRGREIGQIEGEVEYEEEWEGDREGRGADETCASPAA